MGHFGYAETSPSSPLNGPEAVDREVDSQAQDREDGEVECHGLHQVQNAAHSDAKIARTRSN